MNGPDFRWVGPDFRWVAMYPRNLPELTPNEHLAGLSFVGVKNGHDEVTIQISVKISMNAFTKSNLHKEIFTKNFAVKSCTNIG